MTLTDLFGTPRRIEFLDTPPSTSTLPNHTILLGQHQALKSIEDFTAAQILPAADTDTTSTQPLPDASFLQELLPSSSKTSITTRSTYLTADQHQFHWAVLPDTPSRHLHPLSVHAIPATLRSLVKASTARLIVVLENDSARDAIATAVGKAFPLYNRKTKGSNDDDDDSSSPPTLTVEFYGSHSPVDTLATLCDGVRQAGRWMDMTPAELTTTAWAQEIRSLVQDLNADSPTNIQLTEVVGEELREQGYGGLYGVGKGAVEPPRMMVLEYDARQEESTTHKKTVALVGKGIVYDTGGLALKTKTGMCGMKHDMGGAAGLLGGFLAAIRRASQYGRIVLVLCLAENAIGPNAVRNDDILTLKSGKTVEINNSDAEGRLVLGDGVAYVTQEYGDKGLELVVDMATLTGAQLVATGKTHAGILANSQALEEKAMKAGMRSGDLVYPLLYCPELLMKEFDSKVADMKNSVKDRGNAQTSCAGHFIEAHLAPSYDKGWLHIDMAGPGSKDERGTGYGVGLVVALLEGE